MLGTYTRNHQYMFAAMFLWGFGMGMFIFIQPLFIESLGATTAQVGFALAAGGLAVTALYIPIGMWADRRGRRITILAGWWLASFATILMAVAPDWRWLIPGLIMYQLANFAMPAFNGYVAAESAGRNLSGTLAFITSGAAIGRVISPAIGGWLGEQLGFRAVYLIAGVFFILSSMVMGRISDRPAEPAAGPRPQARALIFSPAFMWQIVFIFLLFFAIELGQILMPKYLQEVRGLRLAQIGWLGTVGSLGVVVLSLAFGQLPETRRWALVLCQLVALAASVLLLSSALLPVIVLACFIHGGNWVVRPIVIGRFARALHPDMLSFGYGFLETAMRLGMALAPAVAGLLYARAPAAPMLAAVAALGITLLLTRTLPTGRLHAPAAVPAHTLVDAGPTHT
jgi:MFS family permease